MQRPMADHKQSKWYALKRLNITSILNDKTKWIVIKNQFSLESEVVLEFDWLLCSISNT